MRVSTSLFQDLATNRILDQQARLSDIQQQLSTGRRILNPSDDPAGSARALDLAKSIDTIESYNRNADFAESRMNVEESALTEVGNVINRIRELAVQANNASATADDRQKIGAEVRERLDQLVALANSTDGNGEYLFAGLSSRNEPFVRRNGEYAYEGDQGTRHVQVGPNRQIETTHSGYEVFLKVPDGSNGYVSEAGNGNTGTGIVSAVNVADASIANDPVYDISFSETPGGAMEYTITDGSGGTVAANVAYQEGEPIAFDGLEISIEGQPEDGDSFTVDRAGTTSLFQAVQRFTEALESARPGTDGAADFINTGNRTLEVLDNATEHLLGIRAELGGRLNRLDQERDANDAAVLELKTTKSGIEDLDYAKAVSDLNLSLTGLRAAQQSYTKIQGLSLFNYL
ncbi:flagellar hook-associated protein FlgL [Ectothiorhodospiraceae bacterium WFHF3C12]|nr:flagellar hook-associated protein FlgL [Ectothiorhodospiraceae bacterium WFHF3C12]